ncbi:NUDIX domain-containing protein [Sphingomonas sp. G124]|uniref:NUDIX domain-containing protein n=1 Tax=Sphingomonas cremea TaxID=2904799 RepID=A0A9X1QKP2_9SPHN|nr:NUDIX domain-containing protein [Sphingomonas cremea]MCF2514835.1 NUDIX domain-containing protein [Sphingomonas cremea]
MSYSFKRQWPSLAMRTGVLPFRAAMGSEAEILLIRRHGHIHWSIPKGKPIAGRELHEAAAIEAYEEAGVTGRVWSNALGSYLHDKTPKLFGERPKIVEVITFALEVVSVELQWPEMDMRERQWVSIKHAADLVRPGQLRDMIKAFVPERVLEAQSD